MIITCNDCESSFKVDDRLINESGSKVRCSKCSSVFVVYPSDSTDENDIDAPASGIAMDADAHLQGREDEAEREEIDSALDDLFDEDEESAEIEETEINLFDDERLPDEEKTPAAELAGAETDEEFELDLDSDFDLETEAEADESEFAFDESDETDLDDLDIEDDELTPEETAAVDDSELDLDFEPEAETDSEAEAAEADLEYDEFDEADLADLELEDDDFGQFDEETADVSGEFDFETEDDVEAGLDDLELEAEGEQGDEIDLSDLENMLGTENGSAVEDERMTAGEDLDLDLEMDVEAEQEEDAEEIEPVMESEESDQLDLSDLELEVDEQTSLDMEAAEASEDLDLDLEMDFEAEQEEDAEEIEPVMESEESDQLDLSDLELELEGDDQTSLDMEAAETSEDFDLDLDLDLDVDAVPETRADAKEAEPALEIDGADELDFSDLQMELEESPPTKEEPVEVSEDLDLSLDLDMGDDLEAEAGAESKEPVLEAEEADELDFSSIEEILESDQKPASEAAATTSPQELDLGLDFEVEKVSGPVEQAGTAKAGDELDFSDLEKMLEGDESPTSKGPGDGETEELDIQFDVDAESAVDSEVAAPEASVQETEDSDFLDIEAMLESGDETVSDDKPGDDLDLALEMESGGTDKASPAAEDDLGLEFDLEEALEEIDTTSESQKDELEFQLLDSDSADLQETAVATAGASALGAMDGTITEEIGATSDDFGSDDFTQPRDLDGKTEIMNAPPVAEVAQPQAVPIAAAKGRKSRSRKPIIILLVFVLLLGGIFIIPQSLGIKIPYISEIKIPYLSDLKFNIPYLSDMFQAEEKDPLGNLKMNPLAKTITGEFVENSKSGMLFVIKGKIKNEYAHPRSHIRVTGKLYQQGQNPAKTETVYCGNLLSDTDLARMDISSINRRLQNKFGERRSNLKVKTGNLIPFMVVFHNLPDNLEEYTVEVAGSDAGNS